LGHAYPEIFLVSDPSILAWLLLFFRYLCSLNVVVNPSWYRLSSPLVAGAIFNMDQFKQLLYYEQSVMVNL